MTLDNIVRTEARLRFLEEQREAFEYRIAEAQRNHAHFSEKLYEVNASIARLQVMLARMKRAPRSTRLSEQ